jgi:hypothetical protein
MICRRWKLQQLIDLSVCHCWWLRQELGLIIHVTVCMGYGFVFVLFFNIFVTNRISALRSYSERPFISICKMFTVFSILPQMWSVFHVCAHNFILLDIRKNGGKKKVMQSTLYIPDTPMVHPIENTLTTLGTSIYTPNTQYIKYVEKWGKNILLIQTETHLMNPVSWCNVKSIETHVSLYCSPFVSMKYICS